MEDWRSLAEKRRVNEICLDKWLRLEIKRISLALYFRERGIGKICLYGFGILGRLVVQSLQYSDILIECIIDSKVDTVPTGMVCCKSVDGWQDEYVLVSVMSDIRNITYELKARGCKHILPLEDILDMLMLEADRISGREYLELNKYGKIKELNKLQVVNFGTGMGYYGFIYEESGVNAFNFSLPQQILEFDYKLLKYYHNKLIPGCKVCFVLPYVIFLAVHVFEIDEINERYYYLLPPDEVEGSCNTYFHAHLERARDRSAIMLKKGDYNQRYVIKTVISTEERKRKVQALLDCWTRELGIESFDSGVVFPWHRRALEESANWLKKSLLLCRENELKPIIIVPPLSMDLLDRISMEFRKAFFYDVLENLEEQIPILDYTKNDEFCNPHFFWEPCFLLKEKAELFTKDVLKKIGML